MHTGAARPMPLTLRAPDQGVAPATCLQRQPHSGACGEPSHQRLYPVRAQQHRWTGNQAGGGGRFVEQSIDWSFDYTVSIEAQDG
jgi:hypothetical protein